MKSKLNLVLLLPVAISLFLAGNADATATANSSISFSNLQIIPETGTITFSNAWTAGAFAQAQNSLGDLDSHTDSNVGGVAAANAMVTFADAHGLADAGNLTEGGSSDVSIPGMTDAQALSTGRGTLSNTFMITGGSGSVNVDLSAAISGLLHVFTDQFGLEADTDVTLNLQVDGNSVLFFHETLTVGPNSDVTMPFVQTLSGSLTLNFDTPYFLLVEADSESGGINAVPEPSALLLFGVALGLLTVGSFFGKKRAVRKT